MAKNVKPLVVPKIDVVTVFADDPLSLSDLTRIASEKIRHGYNSKSYIKILDAHWFMNYNVYVVLFQVPHVFLNATSESSRN